MYVYPSQLHGVAFFYGVTVSCKICDHPKRRDIEKDIMRGLSLRAVADQYKDIGYQSVRTHKNTCIPQAIAASKNGKKIIKFQATVEEKEEQKAIDLVSDLLSLRNIVANILNTFENIEDGLQNIADPVDAGKLAVSKSDILLKAIDRMVKVLDLYARIQGEVNPEQHLHIHNDPHVMEFMRKLHEKLKPFPDAMVAVTEMLQGMGA